MTKPWNEERDMDDAPIYFDAEAANAWASGWNAAIEAVPKVYDYRVYQTSYGIRVPENTYLQYDDRQIFRDLETAQRVRRSNDFIPKSGGWHIERRSVLGGEWEDVPC